MILWRIMIFSKIGNVNIFLAIPRQTRTASAACSAIARYMHWEISAVAILPIQKLGSRTAQTACVLTAGKIMRPSQSVWKRYWNWQKRKTKIRKNLDFSICG